MSPDEGYKEAVPLSPSTWHVDVSDDRVILTFDWGSDVRQRSLHDADDADELARRLRRAAKRARRHGPNEKTSPSAMSGG